MIEVAVLKKAICPDEPEPEIPPAPVVHVTMLFEASRHSALPDPDGNPAIERIPDGLAVPMPTFPAWVMIKRERPEEEAVKRSPEPELSTMSAAEDDWAEMEAVGRWPVLPRISKVARGEVVPIPTKPVPERVKLYPPSGISVAAVSVPPSLTASVVLVRPLLKVRGFS